MLQTIKSVVLYTLLILLKYKLQDQQATSLQIFHQVQKAGSGNVKIEKESGREKIAKVKRTYFIF